MPPLDLRRNLPVGCFAKLIFEYADGNGERMWVEVVQVTETGYVGRLCNKSVCNGPQYGALVTFAAKHIIDASALEQWAEWA